MIDERKPGIEGALRANVGWVICRPSTGKFWGGPAERPRWVDGDDARVFGRIGDAKACLTHAAGRMWNYRGRPMTLERGESGEEQRDIVFLEVGLFLTGHTV